MTIFSMTKRYLWCYERTSGISKGREFVREYKGKDVARDSVWKRADNVVVD